MADYVPSTKNIWPYYAATNKPAEKAGQQALGQNEFIKILVAQMSNQDPLSPMEDKEFIAQMAQFSSLEQLMNMSQAIDRLSQSIGISSSLIGKSVSWLTESTSPVETPVLRNGIVESITIKNGETFAVVGNEQILLSRILSVSLPSTTPEPNPGSDDQPDPEPEPEQGENEP